MERCSSSISRSECRGFTLLELIVVLFLMSIMLAFSVPAFRNSVFLEEHKSDIRRLLHGCRKAKNRAFTTGKSYCLVVDLDQGKAFLSDDPEALDKHSIDQETIPWIDFESRMDSVTYLPDGKTITSGKAVFRFYPEGYSDWGLIRWYPDGSSTPIALAIEPFLLQARLVEQ